MHLSTRPGRAARPRRWPVSVVVFVIIGLLSSAFTAQAIGRQAVVDETNRVRQAEGLRRLYRSTTLERAAVAKAEDMFRLQYFGHTSPTGARFWSWLGAGRAKFSRLAENLARGYKSEKTLLADWMKSGGHRANILNATYTHLGVGIRSGILNKKRTTVVVQLFGKQKTKTALIQ